VSWQLVSFLIVVGVIVAGFAWYERSRPPSQIVALVAALAALAIAGRIAFAAFPNVKPTTDIVIFAGYALGPAPGFAVGALSGLVSNFWFGQGPWTPWQMAGWGLCGILGALLALGVKNAGRYTLALVCGLAAVGYGALQNFSLMATYGGDLSWRHFWLLEGRAIPFEIAHAAGNVALALVAGPAMIRMLVRFRRRFEWQRGDADPPAVGPRTALRTGSVAAILVAVLLVAGFASTRADAAAADSPSGGAAWLARQQNADGGWGASPGDESAADMTGWAMMGLEAEGTNPLDVSRGGHTGVTFLRGELADLTTPGDLARTILALEGAGVDPGDFGGADLVAKLLTRQRGDGSYEGWPSSTAYAVIALRAAGVADVSKSLAWLRGAQNEDGGWGDTANSPSGPDGTGAVLQAMSPASKASHRGVTYLTQTQGTGGGWRLGGNGALNTQSTSWAIQGLLAAGANPARFRHGGASPYDYLAANQEPAGQYRYSRSSDQTPIWVTAQVLVAASEAHLPLPVPARAPKPNPSTSSSNPSTSSPSSAPPPTSVPSPETSVPESPTSNPAAKPPVPTQPLPKVSGGPAHVPGKRSRQAGGVGSPRERFATPGQKRHGGSPKTSRPGGRESGGTRHPRPPKGSAIYESGTATANSPSRESDPSDNSSSPLPAIAAGALAGILIVALAWLARRTYRRRRGP
jgi:energy-coupling factor transport system substrate-specific component